ncbi:hypothetical protein PIB30_097697 [Stylosanthes scabra]|uniref:Uncharacterized protein n=1 Tax=Stylosanthes scabra TaxID=79078 RepID=A0ABU6YXR7_9FABA|nr:hypothetical protein [Stylosanthes scabra]
MALISSCQAAARPTPRCWFLPSTFATDILAWEDWDVIAHAYQDEWMRETIDLEHLNALAKMFKTPRDILNFQQMSPNPRH